MTARIRILLLLLVVSCSTVEIARAERKPGFFSSITQRLFGFGRKNGQDEESARPAPTEFRTGGRTAPPPAADGVVHAPQEPRRTGFPRGFGWGSLTPKPLVRDRRPTSLAHEQPRNVTAPGPDALPKSGLTQQRSSTLPREERVATMEIPVETTETPVAQPQPQAVVVSLDRPASPASNQPPAQPAPAPAPAPRKLAADWLVPPQVTHSQPERGPLMLANPELGTRLAARESLSPTVPNPLVAPSAPPVKVIDSRVAPVSFAVPWPDDDTAAAAAITDAPQLEASVSTRATVKDQSEDDTQDAADSSSAEAAMVPSVLPTVFRKSSGEVVAFDDQHGIVQVQLADGETLITGTELKILAHGPNGRRIKAVAAVVAAGEGEVTAQIQHVADGAEIQPGDRIEAWHAAVE